MTMDKEYIDKVCAHYQYRGYRYHFRDRSIEGLNGIHHPHLTVDNPKRECKHKYKCKGCEDCLKGLKGTLWPAEGRCVPQHRLAVCFPTANDTGRKFSIRWMGQGGIENLRCTIKMYVPGTPPQPMYVSVTPPLTIGGYWDDGKYIEEYTIPGEKRSDINDQADHICIGQIQFGFREMGVLYIDRLDTFTKETVLRNKRAPAPVGTPYVDLKESLICAAILEGRRNVCDLRKVKLHVTTSDNGFMEETALFYLRLGFDFSPRVYRQLKDGLPGLRKYENGFDMTMDKEYIDKVCAHYQYHFPCNGDREGLLGIHHPPVDEYKPGASVEILKPQRHAREGSTGKLLKFIKRPPSWSGPPAWTVQLDDGPKITVIEARMKVLPKWECKPECKGCEDCLKGLKGTLWPFDGVRVQQHRLAVCLSTTW